MYSSPTGDHWCVAMYPCTDGMSRVGHRCSYLNRLPLFTSRTSPSIRACVWKSIEGKYRAFEGLGHKECSSSSSFAIAKLISRRVTPSCTHSGHMWGYLSPCTEQKSALCGGWEMVSHFNLHVHDLLMWLSIFMLSIGCWIFPCCSSPVCTLCPFFLVDCWASWCWYRGASYIPDSNLLSVIYTNVFCCLILLHLVKCINLIPYVLCFDYCFKNLQLLYSKITKILSWIFFCKFHYFSLYYFEIRCLHMV